MKITLILTAIGSLAGFAYASFAGCDPSACFVSSSASTSTVVGAFAGLVVALPVNLSLKKKYIFQLFRVDYLLCSKVIGRGL